MLTYKCRNLRQQSRKCVWPQKRQDRTVRCDNLAPTCVRTHQDVRTHISVCTPHTSRVIVDVSITHVHWKTAVTPATSTQRHTTTSQRADVCVVIMTTATVPPSPQGALYNRRRLNHLCKQTNHMLPCPNPSRHQPYRIIKHGIFLKNCPFLTLTLASAVALV